MLSKEDNQLLCRVGPGTPMGNLMRQYWLPAIRSDELPASDCPPLRVKLLGEELIGFRMTSGRVGLIQSACPHRGASLYYGRNEDEGLRCVYHGWKFDGEGRCVDMPSEPAESNFKGKVQTAAYKTHERNGIIWAYMGPRTSAEVPLLPDLEATLLSSDPERISILHRACNWMQGLEGELDTVHAAFLHWGFDEPGEPGSLTYYHFRHRAHPHFTAMDTDFGCAYGCYRPAEADSYYWRIGHVLFPFYAMQAAGPMGPEAKLNAYVPMDDEHTLQWELYVRTDGTESGFSRAGRYAINRGGASEQEPTRRGRYVPQGTGWHDRFNIEQNLANDYLIDREAQREKKSFSGIPGIRQQDMAMTETMGPIYNRSNEHLGTSDSMIIRARRRWIAAAKALRDEGALPPGVDAPELYRQRSGEVVLPRSVDWWDGTKQLRERFDAKVERPVAVGGAGG